MQKYNKGDHVRIAEDLGPLMRHFESGCEAIIMYTYAEKYGGEDYKSYCVHIKEKGGVSWYYEHQLDLIEAGRIDLLEQWELEEKQETNIKSNLDWIFNHGEEVLESACGATVTALAECLGFTNLWGSRGEGLNYYSNAMITLAKARPFLEVGDKEGWLKYCKR